MSGLSQMMKEFGTDHIYSADLFMEMVPKSNKTSYLSSTSSGVFKAMLAADLDAIWSLQPCLVVVLLTKTIVCH